MLARNRRDGLEKRMAHFIVSEREAGQSILQVIRGRRQLSWSQAKRLLSDGRVSVAVHLAVKPTCDFVAASALTFEKRRRPSSRSGAPTSRLFTWISKSSSYPNRRD